MYWISCAGYNYLSIKGIVQVNLHNIVDNLKTVMASIIDSAYEWAHISCPGLGCQERLVGRENQCYIGFNFALGEFFYGFQALGGHWNLDVYVRVDFG